MLISFIIAGIVFLIDQLTKILIYGSPARSIVGNLLWFESTLNTGVAFSMFKDNSSVFIVISSIASLILIFLIATNYVIKNNRERICLGFILGGTIANLIDRILFGGVRDFIYLKFINFAIFNIADMAISFGAGFLCFFILYYEWKNYKKEQLEKSQEEKIEDNSDINTKNENIKENDITKLENSKNIDEMKSEEKTSDEKKEDVVSENANTKLENNSGDADKK
ncbi:MAG: signal peptidase II [Clostridia bacterium]|nr:signal peptidase II [Clostridia bacterium]